jgi:hypothetical protein
MSTTTTATATKPMNNKQKREARRAERLAAEQAAQEATAPKKARKAKKAPPIEAPAPAPTAPAPEQPAPQDTPEEPRGEAVPIRTLARGEFFEIDGRRGVVLATGEEGDVKVKYRDRDGKVTTGEYWARETEVRRREAAALQPAPAAKAPRAKNGTAGAPIPVAATNQTDLAVDGRKVEGQAVTLIVRWMGYHDWTLLEAKHAVALMGITISDATFKCQVSSGRHSKKHGGDGTHGAVPEFSKALTAKLATLRGTLPQQ